MELNKEQLQRIEHYLNVKDITYIDIRMEVFDHIVSDIEAKMMDEKLGFETTFYSVTDKWNYYLKETSSWLFGIAYSAPRIVLEKAKKYFKKWFFLLFPVFIFPYFFIDIITIFLSDDTENSINLVFKIVSVLSFIFFTYMLIEKSKNKAKTTYNFILKTQSLNILFGAVVLLKFNYLNKEGTLDPFMSSLLFAFVFATFSYFHFYKKHKKAIKKYKFS